MAFRARYRYATPERVTEVLTAWRDLFMVQGSCRGIRAYTRRCAGELLPLCIPSDWVLRVAVIQNFRYWLLFHAKREVPVWWQRICCNERLEFIGICHRKSQYVEALIPFFMFMGRGGRLWCYSGRSHVLYLVALSIDELARRGLMHLEAIYEDPDCMPRITTQPESVVKVLIERCESVPSRYRSLRPLFDSESLEMVFLHTPGEGERPLILYSEITDLARTLPFANMSGSPCEALGYYFGRRLACPWYMIGVIGDITSSGTVHTDAVVVIDAFKALYAFDVADRELRRIADNVHMLLRIGLAKLYTPGRRFETRREQEGRLEAPPICVHEIDRLETGGRNGSSRHCRDYHSMWLWLTRRERFRGLAKAPWYETDPGSSVAWGEAGETGDGDADLVDRETDARSRVSIVRGCDRRPLYSSMVRGRLPWPECDKELYKAMMKEVKAMNADPEHGSLTFYCEGETLNEADVMLIRAARCKIVGSYPPWTIPRRRDVTHYALGETDESDSSPDSDSSARASRQDESESESEIEYESDNENERRYRVENEGDSEGEDGEEDGEEGEPREDADTLADLLSGQTIDDDTVVDSKDATTYSATSCPESDTEAAESLL
ncbi:B153 [miniopterid betaherpesvirus 1]|uniref:B153 n=1 Tax=miniopterid betaherpesvirus 1 TaxID=3070189 RepID=I3VQF5_9BETA|nr:B153 [miniopterid betaherpesvirus 1]AFK83999.1 B153 [miniopterid betaherpesvirus 1]